MLRGRAQGKSSGREPREGSQGAPGSTQGGLGRKAREPQGETKERSQGERPEKERSGRATRERTHGESHEREGSVRQIREGGPRETAKGLRPETEGSGGELRVRQAREPKGEPREPQGE